MIELEGTFSQAKKIKTFVQFAGKVMNNIEQFRPKISPRVQIKTNQEAQKLKSQELELQKVVKRDLSSVEKMFKLAEWNRGLKRKRAYSSEHKKVIFFFDKGKFHDENLIPSYDQNYLIRKMKANRIYKNWSEWRCDMQLII